MKSKTVPFIELLFLNMCPFLLGQSFHFFNKFQLKLFYKQTGRQCYRKEIDCGRIERWLELPSVKCKVTHPCQSNS